MDRYAPRPSPHINSIIAEVEEGFNLIVWLRTSEVDSLLLADEPVPTLEEAHARTYRLGREHGIDPEDIEIRTKLVTEHADTQRAISDPGAPRFGLSGGCGGTSRIAPLTGGPSYGLNAPPVLSCPADECP